MAAGAILGGKCFPSQSAALDAYYGAMAPTSQPGTSTYFNAFVKDAGVWKLNQYNVSAGGSWALLSTSAAPVPTFPDCDPAQSFLDGATLGWGVALCIVCAWCFRVLRMGL
jgi:hypothetical protein